MKKFNINNKEYILERYPQIANSQLQAWNSADEYLLNEFFSLNIADSNILILNDQYGALTIPLMSYNLALLSDSYLTKNAIKQNLINNSLNEKVNFIPADINISNFDNILFNTVLIKIPKSINYLRYQLNLIKKAINRDTVILATGMVKHLSPNLKNIFDEEIGTTNVHRTYKKSVLFEVQTKADLEIDSEIILPKILQTDINSIKLSVYPNVFSQEKVDNGTRLLLQNLPRFEDDSNIADLGCGNGIIGITAYIKNKTSNIICIDESYLAIKSAKESFHLNKAKAKFMVNDGLGDLEENSLNYVISNPPFHSQTTLDINEAERHFRPVINALKKAGKFILVCNRGLNYEPHLKKYFSEVKRIDQNKKYFIIECIK